MHTDAMTMETSAPKARSSKAPSKQTVVADAPQVAGTPVRRRASEMFGAAFGNAELPGFAPGPQTPSADPHYVFREDHVRVGLLWLSGRIKNSLYLSGPTSAGKTSFVEQLCARTGFEVFRFGCHKDVELVDLTGGMDLTTAGTEFCAGILLKAMAAPAGVLLLDEVDLLSPSVTASLHTVLDGKPLWVPQAKTFVYPGPNFRIAATGNSSGLGDHSKVYKAVQRQNTATIRRFMHLKVDYLSETEEMDLLKRVVPTLDPYAVELMTKVAALTRKAFVGGLSDTGLQDEQLDVVIGTDALITWAKLTLAFEASPALRAKGRDPLEEALNPVLLNCLLDPGNAHKAHAISGFLERVRKEMLSGNHES